MDKLIRKYSIPLFIISIALMLLIDLASFEYTTNDISNQMINNTLLRLIGGMLFFLLLYAYGYKKMLKNNKPLFAIMIAIPGFIIAVNNFPISAYLQGRTTLVEPHYAITLFFIESLSVGFFEELIVRVLLLSLIFDKLKDRSNGLLKSIILSSLIFGVIHLINLFEGASVPNTLLQVGYSFLMGLLFSVLYIKTKNIWIVMLVHALYNFFGQVMFQLGVVVNRYDTVTVVVTSIFAILTVIYGIRIYLTEKDSQFLADFEDFK